MKKLGLLLILAILPGQLLAVPIDPNYDPSHALDCAQQTDDYPACYLCVHTRCDTSYYTTAQQQVCVSNALARCDAYYGSTLSTENTVCVTVPTAYPPYFKTICWG